MNPPDTLKQLARITEDIADSMTKVAVNIAMLGVQGDADEQMRIITEENNKVLDRIRQLYNLPKPPEQTHER